MLARVAGVAPGIGAVLESVAAVAPGICEVLERVAAHRSDGCPWPGLAF